MKRDKNRPRSPLCSPRLAARRVWRSGKGRDRLGGGDEPSEAERLAQLGWIDWGGELIWAVGFTEGGAPFGLRAEELDPADLQEMGVALGATSSWDDHELRADGWLPEDDVE